MINENFEQKLQATRRRFLHSLAIFGMAMVLATCQMMDNPGTSEPKATAYRDTTDDDQYMITQTELMGSAAEATGTLRVTTTADTNTNLADNLGSFAVVGTALNGFSITEAGAWTYNVPDTVRDALPANGMITTHTVTLRWTPTNPANYARPATNHTLTFTLTNPALAANFIPPGVQLDATGDNSDDASNAAGTGTNRYFTLNSGGVVGIDVANSSATTVTLTFSEALISFNGGNPVAISTAGLNNIPEALPYLWVFDSGTVTNSGATASNGYRLGKFEFGATAADHRFVANQTYQEHIIPPGLALDASGDNSDDSTNAAGTGTNRYFEIASGTATVAPGAVNYGGGTFLSMVFTITDTTYHLDGASQETSVTANINTATAVNPNGISITVNATTTHLVLSDSPTVNGEYNYFPTTSAGIAALTSPYYILGTFDIKSSAPSNSTFTANQTLQE